MVFKKKQILAVAMVLVICTGVFLNWRYNKTLAANGNQDGQEYDADKVLGQTELVNGKADEDDYFAVAKLTRQTSRDESIELLQTITTNTNNSEEVRNQAATDISTIAVAIQKEGNIENMLLAKGFEKSLAVVSETGVTVMVAAKDLSQAQLAQITEIVIGETGVKASAITVQKISD